jgi:hypothetical protein
MVELHRDGERDTAERVIIGGPGAANRCLALLSKMFNLAERWGIRPLNSNPVRHADRFPEKSIERYLSVEEFSRLAEVLSHALQSDSRIHLL